MSCPASVSNAETAGNWAFGNQARQAVIDFALFLARFDVAILKNRDAGAVVAAIFKASQTFEDDARSLTFTDVTNNAAHDFIKGSDLPPAQTTAPYHHRQKCSKIHSREVVRRRVRRRGKDSACHHAKQLTTFAAWKKNSARSEIANPLNQRYECE